MTTTSKNSDKKVKTSKVKTVKATKVEPKAKKTKKAELPNAKLAKKEKALVQEITTTNKESLMEKVISKREIKYIYPEDCNDTLARKKFRQQVRNKIHAMENTLFKLGDKTTKDYKKIEKELNAFKSQYVKVDAAV